MGTCNGSTDCAVCEHDGDDAVCVGTYSSQTISNTDTTVRLEYSNRQADGSTTKAIFTILCETKAPFMGWKMESSANGVFEISGTKPCYAEPTPTPKPDKGLSNFAVAAICVGVALVLSLSGALFFTIRRLRRQGSPGSVEEPIRGGSTTNYQAIDTPSSSSSKHRRKRRVSFKN